MIVIYFTLCPLLSVGHTFSLLVTDHLSETMDLRVDLSQFFLKSSLTLLLKEREGWHSHSYLLHQVWSLVLWVC